MHRAGYAALGLEYTYVPFKVTDVPGALVGMRALGIRGLGVSMPYKLEVLPFLDELDGLAERIGAVNTVVNEQGRLKGYNTDAVGARRALEEVRQLNGSRVTVLGAGGAARAVAFSLSEAGASVHIANRTESRAQELSVAIGRASGKTLTSSGTSTKPPAADILVNASSAGMEGVLLEPPVAGNDLASFLGSANLVMDIVYKPMETRLLTEAKRLGKTTIFGGRMLLHQAAAQFELYTGLPAPLSAMDHALHEALEATPKRG